MNDESTNEPIRVIKAARRDNWIIILFLILVLIGSICFAQWKSDSYMHPNPKTYVYTWKDVDLSVSQLNYDNAISIIESVIIKKYPSDSYAYNYLGTLNRRLGNFKEAEKAYQKAYDFFPSEENKRLLDAIQAKNQSKP